MHKEEIIWKNPEQEDIKNAYPLDWNVTVGDEHKKLQVYRVKNCVHTIGSRHQINDLYVANRDFKKEELVPEHLLPFDGGICWGATIQSRNYWRKGELLQGTKAIITLAGEQVYELRGSINYLCSLIPVTIERLKELPIDIQTIDYEKSLIGMKIWWNDQPGIITRYIKNQGCVIIKADNKEGAFKLLNSDADEECLAFTSYTEEDVKDDILSSSIRWFRD